MNFNHLDAKVRIGKRGLSETNIRNIKDILKKDKIVKIKILQNFIKGKDKKDVFNEIAEKTNSKIIKKIGFTLILKK